MVRRWLAIPLLAGIAVSGLLLSGCGDDDETPATAVIGDDGVPVIDQDDLAFKPGELTVAAGQTIRFLNSETALHTVTIEGDNLSGNMRRGDIFEWTPDAPGTYRITCAYHRQMRATITVE